MDSTVYAISLVDEPAIESNFVYLAKQKEQKRIILSSEDRHLVYGAVLIPDMPIVRYDDIDGEFYIQFPKETVEKLAFDYVKSGRVGNFTTQHKDETDKISIIESWIKTSENDKSRDLGLDCPIGTWFVGAKVEDETIWSDIKEGKMNGFSIESFLNMEEIMLSKNNTFNNQNKKENLMSSVEINDGFFLKIMEAIKGALQEPEVPELEANVTAAQFVDELKDEVVSAEPVVDEVMEEAPVAEVEPPVTEEMVNEEVAEVVSDESTMPEEIAEEVVNEVEEVAPTEEVATETIQEVIAELNQKIDELNAEIDELRKENMKLSKRPSVKPVNTHMGAQNQSNFDRMLAIMNGSAFQK